MVGEPKGGSRVTLHTIILDNPLGDFGLSTLAILGFGRLEILAPSQDVGTFSIWKFYGLGREKKIAKHSRDLKAFSKK